MPLDRRRVQVELAALPAAVPDAVERDLRNCQQAVRADTETRTRAERRRVEHAAAHEDATRLARIRGEEVAVDADDRRACRELLLHVGQLFSRDDGVVREHWSEGVQRPVGARRSDDIEDDGAVRSELHVALVGDAGHQQRLRDNLHRGALRRAGGQRDDSGEHDGDEDLAEHDPTSG